MHLCSRYRALLIIMSYAVFLANAHAQTTTVIPANEAAEHVGEYATVEGVVAKVFTSDKGNTFLNIGASYPNQSFTTWIPPASPVSKSPLLTRIEGKHIKITGRIEMYRRYASEKQEFQRLISELKRLAMKKDYSQEEMASEI
jgi:hypothetical protein